MQYMQVLLCQNSLVSLRLYTLYIHYTCIDSPIILSLYGCGSLSTPDHSRGHCKPIQTRYMECSSPSGEVEMLSNIIGS